MKQLFINLILQGRLKDASFLSQNFLDSELELLMAEEACNNENIAVFVYACFLFQSNKTLKYCNFVGSILGDLCFLRGAYAGEYGYLLLAQKYGLSELVFWQRQYYFFIIPDRIVNGLEIRLSGKKILFQEPENKIGINIIAQTEKYEGKRLRNPGKNMPAHKKCKLFIRRGRFLDALDQISLVPYEALVNVLRKIASKKNITAYAFLWTLIYQKETAALHVLAAEMFLIDFNHLNGAWAVMFFHTHRAAELEPDTIEIQEKLLNLYEPGNASFDVEETKKRAQKILELKPESEPALRVLRLLDDLR